MKWFTWANIEGQMCVTSMMNNPLPDHCPKILLLVLELEISVFQWELLHTESHEMTNILLHYILPLFPKYFPILISFSPTTRHFRQPATHNRKRLLEWQAFSWCFDVKTRNKTELFFSNILVIIFLPVSVWTALRLVHGITSTLQRFNTLLLF